MKTKESIRLRKIDRITLKLVLEEKMMEFANVKTEIAKRWLENLMSAYKWVIGNLATKPIIKCQYCGKEIERINNKKSVCFQCKVQKRKIYYKIYSKKHPRYKK